MDELDQFRITVQQMEIARDLVLARAETGCRVALILLDNAGETMLYRIVQEEFESDAFTRAFVPERYPPKARREIDRLFAAKVKAVTTARRLPASVGATLLVLHAYRNAAYHRDSHNPAVLPLLARVALIAVADLFARTRGGIRTSGVGGYRKPMAWLQPYGFGETSVNLDVAARSIARKLKTRVRPTLPALVQGFASDIGSRISAVREVLTNRLAAPSEQEINRILKWFEFVYRNPDLESKLSEDYRALNYRIASGHGKEVTRDEYVDAEAKFRDGYRSAHEEYRPACMYAGLVAIETDVAKVNAAKDYRDAVQCYAALDARITTFEQVTFAARREIEYQSEMESDIRRGK